MSPINNVTLSILVILESSIGQFKLYEPRISNPGFLRGTFQPIHCLPIPYSDEERRLQINKKREEAQKRRSQITPAIDLNSQNEIMDSFERDMSAFENGFRKTSSIF